MNAKENRLVRQRAVSNLEAVLVLVSSQSEKEVATWKTGQEPDIMTAFHPEIYGSMERIGQSLVARVRADGTELKARMPLMYDQRVKHFQVRPASAEVELTEVTGRMEARDSEIYKVTLTIQQLRKRGG